jgi:hypothetical protein
MFEQDLRRYAAPPTPVKTDERAGIVAPVQRFTPGDPIVLREIWADRVFEARPMVVVQDDPDQLMLYLPAGVRCGVPVDAGGSALRIPDRPWRFELRARGVDPNLSFAWPGVPYAVILLTVAEPPRRVWYVNLERPVERTPIGFDTVDHALDLVVELDGSSWRWKDEDELARAIRAGLFTEEEAADFRRWGERARDRVLAGEPPFDRDWTSWRPDPSWPIPQLRHGWERL